jgi:hypothetical protein
MARIVRVSGFVMWSMALLVGGLTGCDQRPETGTLVRGDEEAHERAVGKMQDFMRKQQEQKAQSPGARKR